MTPSELRALAEARDEMRKRAMAWVYDAGTGGITSRDEAVNEQEMALDVIAILDQLAAAEAECERLGTLAAARATVQAACRCGSGGHPRECEAHPLAYDAHVAELNELAEINEELSNLRAQLAAVSAARDEACDKAEAYADHPTLDVRVLARIAALRAIGATK